MKKTFSCSKKKIKLVLFDQTEASPRKPHVHHKASLNMTQCYITKHRGAICRTPKIDENRSENLEIVSTSPNRAKPFFF